MTGILLKITDMSFAASWMILAVLGLRLLLRTIPKWGRVLMWGLVEVRLLVPFSMESRFSMIPGIQPVDTPSVITVFHLPAAESTGTTVTSSLSFESAISVIWLTGVVILIGYFAVSYLRLLRRLDTAVLLRDNIYQSELVADPMVVGIVKPRIYIPYRIDDRGMEFVVLHEQTHIRRGDHWWKLMAFVCVSLHWFNPLVWISYTLLCRDIELACDEAVISGLDHNGRGDYAQTLMAFSVKGSGFPVHPMGFSTVDAKSRIRAIVSYRRAGAGQLLILAVCSLVLAVCFLTEPVTQNPELSMGMGTTAHTHVPSADLPSEEELQAELEVLKRNLSSYQAHLADADDLLGLRLSMTFYRSMIQELENKIISVEQQIGM